MSVTKIMSKPLVTLDLDDDLEQAKSLFDKHNIHHILIIENKELVGIITDRDLHKHLSPNIGTRQESFSDTALLQKKIHLIMSRDLIVAPESITLNEAVLLFHDNHISCLPIVSKKMKPIGIITWRDILKVLAIQYRQRLSKGG